MKLTQTQQQVLDKAKEDILFARTHSITEWAAKDIECDDNEEVARYAEKYARYYELEKSGIVLTQCNSRTIKKLESLGLIEIIKDGGSYCDSIKVLNF